VRLALVVAMAACLAGLFAVPAARSTFALALPPASVLLAEAAVVLIAICALALWQARPRFQEQ
jgi:Co/Zn/Cd efflux system component